jgi:hypothetical protein
MKLREGLVVPFAVVVWILLRRFYISRLHEGLPGGDSGELLSTIRRHEQRHHRQPFDAVAHPPGYPLFTILYATLGPILGQLLENRETQLGHTAAAPSPLLRAEWDILRAYCRQNHALSAFLVAGAVAILLALGLRLILESPLCRSSTASLLATSTLVMGGWSIVVAPAVVEAATTTEVFALHYFLIACFLAAIHPMLRLPPRLEQDGAAYETHFWEGLSKTRRCCVAVSAGLLMSNQQLALFPLFWVAAWIVMYRLERPWSVKIYAQLLAWASLAICVALMLYGFVLKGWWRTLDLWLANLMKGSTEVEDRNGGEEVRCNPYGWGSTRESWSGFWDHVLRREYGTWQLHAGYGLGNQADPVSRTDSGVPSVIDALTGAQGFSDRMQLHLHWTASQVPLLFWSLLLVPLLLMILNGVASALQRYSTSAAKTKAKGQSHQLGPILRHYTCLLSLPLLCAIPLDWLANIPLSPSSPPVYLHVYSRLWSHTLFLLWPAFSMGVVHVWLQMDRCWSAVVARLVGKGKAGMIVGTALVVLIGCATPFALGSSSLSSIGPSSISGAQEVDAAANEHIQRLPLAFALSTVRSFSSPAGSERIGSSPRSASVLITSGDIYVTTIRFALTLRERVPQEHFQVGSTEIEKRIASSSNLIHVDRELFYYPWARKKLQTCFPNVSWPMGLIKSPTPVFTNMLLFSKSLTHSSRAHSTSPNQHAAKLFSIETSEIIDERPSWKDKLATVASGWFYEFVPKEKKHCPPSLLQQLGEALAVAETSSARVEPALEAERLRGVFAKVIDDYLASGGLGEFRQLVDIGLIHRVVRQANADFGKSAGTGKFQFPHLYLRYPWELSVYEMYKIAVKNVLLQAASDFQLCASPFLLDTPLKLRANEGKVVKGGIDQAQGRALVKARKQALANGFRRILELLDGPASDASIQQDDFRLPSTYEKAVLPFRNLLSAVIADLEG